MRMDFGIVLFLAGVFLVASNPCVWAHTDVTAEQARDLIDSTEGLIVVDVRERSEYCDAVGHIPGAVNYPWNSGVLPARYEELPSEGPILVVCRSGARSNAAATFLDRQGFSNVYDMLGGMGAWTWETAPCKYSGGSGKADDPYQIATAEDLIALGETPEDYDKHFILTADINLDPNLPGCKAFDNAVIAPDTDPCDVDWQEGDSFTGPSFRGVFDGDSHTILHLTITGRSHLGLFGRLGSAASVANLGLEAVDVRGTGAELGGLAGFCEGSIRTCYSTGTVSGDTWVGGLIGVNEDGSITASYSSATVDGRWMVGGLVGYNEGSIGACCSTGEVSGPGAVGGLAGANWWEGSIAMSYSAGTVTGDAHVGGLVGESTIGGSIASSFWDVEASGQSSSVGGTGVTVAQMQDISTFLDAGWDLVNETANGTCDYWEVSAGEYPRLRFQTGAGPRMPEGLGTAGQPYLIRDANDLGAVWFEPLAHYRLEAPLDLSGITWSMAVAPWFNGTFDGNGKVISGLYIEGSGWLGMFGQTGSEAVISGLGLAAVDVNGVGERVGGLAACNRGSIAASYSSGTVAGGMWVGGLVGDNWGSISRSYSTGAVDGEYPAGGLVGWNRGNIASAYSTVIASRWETGGLVGANEEGGHVAESFWDEEISGLPFSSGGMGLTTTEMQTVDTFLEAGWDFVCETANGVEDIWWMPQGEYPRLVWEVAEVPPCPGVVVELDETNFGETVGEGVVLVDFYATWCSHCRVQAPIMDEVAAEVGGKAVVGKLDIDEARSVANAYGVTAIPTLIVFRNGSVFERFLGETQAFVLIAAIQAAIDHEEAAPR